MAGLRHAAHRRRLLQDGFGRRMDGSAFLGFMGMYTVLSVLFLFLVRREIEHGPEPVTSAAKSCGVVPATPVEVR